MKESSDLKKIKLTSTVKTSGCAAKLPPKKLYSILNSLPKMPSPNLIGGFENADDALVYKINDDMVCVQTVDFFPPMVDDPFTFGMIAAANALSDVYAMGGVPSVAMNLMCFPSCFNLSIMKEVLLGGIEKIKESGAIIAGGHTIEDPTLKYGLSVTGFMNKNDVWSNSNAKVEDCLVLTKSIGVGVINTAAKVDEAKKDVLDCAIKSMTTLNKKARDIATKYDIHSATDVTGFSLSGHSFEMAKASGVTIEIDTKKIPFIKGALDLASYGFIPEGRYTNEEYLKEYVSFPHNIQLEIRDLCYDPQTSGGLLLSMSPKDAQNYIDEMKEENVKIIGRIKERGKSIIEYI